MIPAADLSEWPGLERRRPAISDPSRLVLQPLARGLEDTVARDLAPSGDRLSILDIGCGAKPYLPFFASVASEYLGVDVHEAPSVDIVAPAEELPFGEARFDAVLCTQTLEHVADPGRAVAEIHRVLRPGGLAMLSTHGTAVYHPCPTDLWRWTQEGLVKLFDDNGLWASTRLEPCGGTAACFGALLAFYIAGSRRPGPLKAIRAVVIAITNSAFGALDRIVPLHYPRRHTLISNFLVVARKAPS